MTDKMGRVRPTICEMANSGMEVTCEATVMGIPMAPEGHRSRIGNEANASRVQRVEA